MPIFGGPFTSGSTEIVLDPSEVAVDRAELHLNTGPINVNTDGIDWGDAQIEQYLAEASVGQLPVDFRVPNRIITIPLLIGAAGPASFPAAKAQLQAKVALFQREGGWIRRAAGIYADITNATLKFPDHYGEQLGVENAELTLEARPDFYGTESTLTGTASGASHLYEDVPGDYPSRVRFELTEDSSSDQSGLIWGLRCRHYSADATAVLELEAQDLTPTDTAAAATVGGFPVVQHAGIGLDWTGVLSTEIAGVGHLTHTGSYRVWARILSTVNPGTDPPRARLVWDVGDLVLPVENTPVRLPGGDAWYWLDLGAIRLDPPPVGTHRWQGLIQANGEGGGEAFSVHQIKLFPADEGYGVLRAEMPEIEGLNTPFARDGFAQTAGALVGKTAPLGGAWAGAGDTTDFVVETAGHTAQRTAVADSPARFETLPTNRVGVAVQVDVMTPALAGASVEMGVLARYVNTSNHLFATAEIGSGGGGAFTMRTLVAGVLAGESISTPWLYPFTAGTWYTVRLQVEANGYASGWFWPAGTPRPLSPQITFFSAALAPGGALATGLVGLRDFYADPTPAATRNYDNFTATPVVADAVLYADRSLELRHDGMYREASDGAAHGPVSNVTGSLPRLPPAGLEGRPVEMIVLGSRGDLGQRPDLDPTDELTVTVHARPCWLFAPAA